MEYVYIVGKEIKMDSLEELKELLRRVGPEGVILRVERVPERGIYSLSGIGEEEINDLLQRVERGDVPLPPKEGALFWGPYESRGVLPPDIETVSIEALRTPEGLVAIQEGPGGARPHRVAVWVAERVAPLFGGALAAQTMVNVGLLVETPQGTLQVSSLEGFWGVLFEAPWEKRVIRLEADNPEKLVDHLMQVVHEHKFRYRPGVNIYFL